MGLVTPLRRRVLARVGFRLRSAVTSARAAPFKSSTCATRNVLGQYKTSVETGNLVETWTDFLTLDPLRGRRHP